MNSDVVVIEKWIDNNSRFIQSDMYSLPDETDWSSENVSNSVVLPPTETGE